MTKDKEADINVKCPTCGLSERRVQLMMMKKANTETLTIWPRVLSLS